ncbi:hypothetical protein ABG82_19345 [Mycobacteroides immunogenum]|uniref:Uncharacterized protein n=1 Tax=Mycobacteroides immunogenum TaxID=83262 RepID=A0ABR5LKY2_9MYCO|nr:hypothetical protein ABG82_19345 [Mycobacteroides immunogenum]ANO05258.1 hypothetical protein BAB75_19605 [Mycobacteroides immunogenum]KIU38009.1 hypothetical protein TL11_24925 [Mycobacteroides immunogenum]KPG04229.1 hypothetical protein AN909_23420 [Mycobacteroides immunogenum]KPG05613.1 hypothetical protein AN910_23160 [Mycobacteroides immunogenum]
MDGIGSRQLSTLQIGEHDRWRSPWLQVTSSPHTVQRGNRRRLYLIGTDYLNRRPNPMPVQ